MVLRLMCLYGGNSDDAVITYVEFPNDDGSTGLEPDVVACGAGCSWTSWVSFILYGGSLA